SEPAVAAPPRREATGSIWFAFGNARGWIDPGALRPWFSMCVAESCWLDTRHQPEVFERYPATIPPESVASRIVAMKPKELTLRRLLLGSLITTASPPANVSLGLKVGSPSASSIPAAVMSMAILSAVKDSSILENNIVQTVASAAGTLSAIIFVLPGLV